MKRIWERSAASGQRDRKIQNASAVVHGGTIMALLGHFLGGEYFDYQVKCGQGYSGRLAFKAGGGAPQWKEFRPLSEATVSEAAVSELTKEKRTDEISYPGIWSGIFTGSDLWRSLFSATSHPGNRLVDREDRKALRSGNPQEDSPEREAAERRQGKLLVAIVLLLTGMFTALILAGAYALYPRIGMVVEAVMTYQILAARCLQVESGKVWKHLKAGNPEAAREAVSMIVGRDTQNLTEEGVAKAAIETVAENTSDGVIAPMLYTALGGPVLGFYIRRSIPWILWSAIK